MLPALKVFIIVVAVWAKMADGSAGMAGYNESHAFASQADCNAAHTDLVDQVKSLSKKGVVAYSITPCLEMDMTLTGERDANAK